METQKVSEDVVYAATLQNRYRIDEFRYCEKTDFLESAIGRKECGDWESPG